jgi:uncharacterized protein (DUF2461 family)
MMMREDEHMDGNKNIFKGFPHGIKEFLENLKFCNTMEAQTENIVEYKRLITEPLGLLYEALLPTVNKISDRLETKKQRCVSSPYTDRRFSPKAPLKEYVYIRFRQYGKDENVPSVYFDMGADYYSYGLWIFKRTPAGMNALRNGIMSSPGKYTSALDTALSAGLAVGGESYKKDHFPEMPDSPLKSLLNRKQFYIGRDFPVGKNVYTGAFADEIAAAFTALGEFLNLLEDETFCL